MENAMDMNMATVAVALAVQSLAPGPDSESAVRTIAADLAGPSQPMNRAYRVCVGAGRANEGLRADWQQQLAEVRRELGFEYIRFHGLFHEDMGVCRRDPKSGALQFNWQYVDALFDFLLSIGMKPFVELSFMPKPLASGTQTVFWWQGNVTPPKQMDEWAALVRDFTEHVTARYGADEVRTWYFEVWNEPNHNYFWSGTQEQYFELYRASAAAVKGVDPAYRVGGPSTAGCGWIQELAAFCAKENVPLDFFSTHTYNVKGALDEFGTQQQQLMDNVRQVGRDFRRVRKLIEETAFAGRELHFTEWSASYSSRDPVHDDYFSAPFILEQIKLGTGHAQSMSYWVFTDIFEESGIPMKPFHGGFGLMNLQGIKKTAYWAYAFLQRLGDRAYATEDASSWVCADDGGGAQVLFWDLAHPFPDGKTVNQQGFIKERPSAVRGPVALQLAGLKPGRYSVEEYRAGYGVNDPYSRYLAMGAPARLTRSQVAELKALSTGAPTHEHETHVGADGVWRGRALLRENDVVLVKLTPQR